MRGIILSFALGAIMTFPLNAGNKSEAPDVSGKTAESQSVVTEGTNPSPDVPEKVEKLDSVVVSASRAGKSTPVTYTMVSAGELRSANPINSLPMVLSLQPSVVTYNEGGTGLGNSAMTVRGAKGSQINVTLNGITLNDAESQEVFWVNIPALTNLISSVQLQRGLGTTANGSGAFGASVNMNTASVGADPSVRIELSAGSWNTFSGLVSASTGLTSKGLYASAAYSKSSTDGYIRNAFVQSQSAFVTLGWLHGTNSFRFTWLMGDQRSGITWDGIDFEMYDQDRRYNGAGEWYDEYGNVHYYDNQTDNYTQNHLQLNWTHQFSDAVTWSSTLNYTRGDGYDEYYKSDRDLSKYGLSGITGTDGSTYTESDVIHQKKMGNDSWVLNSDVRWRTEKVNITAGLNLSSYYGDHWGKLLWAKAAGDSYDWSSFNSGRSWYSNDASKREADIFARMEYRIIPVLTAYVDLQGRFVHLDMYGQDDDYWEMGQEMMDYEKTWSFFNPRAGLTWDMNETGKLYGSIAYGNREPGRSDIKENIKGENTPISPEKMIDVEIGYSYAGNKFSGSANVYLMEYWDMLAETGRLSSSGYAVKENVDRAWRRGIELASAWTPAGWARFDANATLSINKIKDYTSYVEVWDGEPYETKPFHYGKSDILLSPSVIGMARLSVTPWKNIASGSLRTTTFCIDGKYVGKQYIDNTGREEMEIPQYFVMNASASHSFNVGGGQLTLSAYVNNMLNNRYWAYGWRWEGCNKADETPTTGIGVYPQATVNFLFKVAYSF